MDADNSVVIAPGRAGALVEVEGGMEGIHADGMK